MSPYKSLTHVHLLAAMRTEMAAQRTPKSDGPFRILDAGCGNGALLAFIMGVLSPQVRRPIELYGFDVGDHGVQRVGFINQTISRLAEECPGPPWHERILAIDAAERWPFPSEHFDVVLSNQVLEHVSDHAHFFREIARTLQTGGVSLNLFPVRECFVDGHLHLPFVHRINNFDRLCRLIRGLSRVGLGVYRNHGVPELDQFVERHADYMIHFTNYRFASELCEHAKEVGLRASFRFTRHFYGLKLRALMGWKLPEIYPLGRSTLFDDIAFTVLKRVSSVTLALEKRQTYRS